MRVCLDLHLHGLLDRRSRLVAGDREEARPALDHRRVVLTDDVPATQDHA